MKKRKVPLTLLILFSILLIYTIIDNNRIQITEQEVIIENLPDELNGFTILQISDLHEKEFGQEQKRLAQKINSISYDVIVFTGDMLRDSKSTNYAPFFTLLEKIEVKEKAFFVPGNTDPKQSDKNQSEFYSGMERRGVKFLDSLEVIEQGNFKIFFANFEKFISKRYRYLVASNDQQNNKSNSLLKLDNIKESDVLIGFTHYPVVDQRMNYIIHSNSQIKKYDLIMAGHYHGGQIRLPFLGALFIPESWYSSGILPPQDRVKGLWEYKDIKQFVSTGLGSSDALPLFKFRLFNTPEINIITLKKEK